MRGVGRTGGAEGDLFGEELEHGGPFTAGAADDLVVGGFAADVVVGGDGGEDGDAGGFGEGLGFAGAVILVDDHAGDADIAAHFAEVVDGGADVVGDVEGLEVVGADDDDLLAHVAGDREAEAAADDVAQEVEEDVVEAPFVEAEFFQEFEAVDDAAAAAAAADFGAAEFHGEDAVADEADVADGDFLAGGFFLGGGLDDGGAGAAAEEEAGGVAFRVAADEEDALALLGHHVAEVGEGEALADAALAVDGDDLRLFLGRGGDDGVGLDGGFEAEGFGHARLGHVSGSVGSGGGGDGVHGLLQSSVILRQAGSLKAVR